MHALAFGAADMHLSVMPSMLNDKQADLLRYLDRQSGPVSSADLDGRVIRALKSRACIEEKDGMVTVTEQGRAALSQRPARRTRGRRPAVEKSAGHARAQAIRRALDALEAALPRDAEVAVGPLFAYADDVVQGFRRYARSLERGRG
jgi:glutathione S-transferase